MADERCPTCGGPCKVKTVRGYVGGGEQTGFPVDSEKHISTAEADARRAAREAAIATLAATLIRHDSIEHRLTMKWIDDHYPPTGVKE